MSSEQSSSLTSSAGPGRMENLVGAILWLPSVKDIPNHGYYKLKAKACDHPCLVVQDCRATDENSVRICILSSYSHETRYTSLGKTEKIDHVPIYPNPPNGGTSPNILYLRSRQKTKMLLRKKSWVNTRRIYKVPVSILKPYENHRSWCRYRLADTSIRALDKVLFPATADSDITLTLPMVTDKLRGPDNTVMSTEESTNGANSEASQGIFFSGDDMALRPDTSASDQSVGNTTWPQLSSAGKNDQQIQDAPLKASENPENSNSRRLPLSDKPSPFHLIYPFDSGPNASTSNDDGNTSQSFHWNAWVMGALIVFVKHIQRKLRRRCDRQRDDKAVKADIMAKPATNVCS